MKYTDPFHVPRAVSREEHILFAGTGFSHFHDEFFLITDGFAGLPHAREAEELTAETAIWAYTAVRQRPFYWKEKLEFLKRIFRSTNLRLWQRRRDPGYGDGLAAAAMVLIAIGDYFWIGSAGNCNSFLFRDGLIDILTARDVDDEGMLTKAVGFARKQLVPTMRSEKLLENDIILMATDSLADFVTEEEMRMVLEDVGTTTEALQTASDKLVGMAKAAGSMNEISLCMVKRIVI